MRPQQRPNMMNQAPMHMMGVPMPEYTQLFTVPEPQIQTYTKPIEPITTDRKPRKKRTDTKPEQRDEQLKDLALEIYIRWKLRKMQEKHFKDVQERIERGEEVVEFAEEQSIKKIERRWKKESADVVKLYLKAAMMENAMLGEDVVMVRKKKKETKIKEECHPYLLFCKEHREEIANGYTGKDVLSVLSDMWKKLDPVEKEKYAEKAKKNKRLQNEMTNENMENIMPIDMGQDQMQSVYFRNDGYLFK